MYPGGYGKAYGIFIDDQFVRKDVSGLKVSSATRFTIDSLEVLRVCGVFGVLMFDF